MKATDIIRRDHRAAEALFDEFNSAPDEERRDIEKRIFKALTAHELMEDRHFYPALLDKAPDDESVRDMVGEQMKIEASATGARVAEAVTGEHDDRMQKVMDTVLEHAEKEEADILPLAETLFTTDELEELGAMMEPDSAVAASSEQ